MGHQYFVSRPHQCGSTFEVLFLFTCRLLQNCCIDLSLFVTHPYFLPRPGMSVLSDQLNNFISLVSELYKTA